MANSTSVLTPFDREAADTYLDVVYGGRPARVALAYDTPGQVRSFSDRETFDVATQRTELLNRASFLTEHGKNVWITPGSVKPGGRRQQDDMDMAYVAYLDLDPGKATPAAVAEGARLLAAEGAYLVHSSEGGIHAYLPLSAPLSAEDLRQVNKGLVQRYKDYGADSAAVDASRLLRLPGTWNFKYQPAQKVTTALEWAGEYADTADLLRRAPVATEPVPEPVTATAPVPDYVMDLFSHTDYQNGQVSEAFHHRVKVCQEAGLGRAQTTTMMTGWITEVDPAHRYLSRMAAEVERSWGKEDTRPQEPSETVPNSQTPEERFEQEVAREERRLLAQIEAKRRVQTRTSELRPKPAEVVLDWDALMDQPLPEFLVDDVLVEGGIGLWYGESGLGKSFAVIDLLMCVATGVPFRGKWVTRQTKTLYVVAEGAYDTRLRALAWAREHGMARVDGFVVYPEPVNLGNEADVDRMVEFAAANEFGLVCLDTVSRCTAGIQENDNGEMARAMEAAKKITTTVLMVHHEGKNAASGMRGATVLKSNADTVIYQHRLKRKVGDKEVMLPQTFFGLYLEKSKASEDHIELGAYERAVVELGPDPRRPGRQLTSCVIQDYAEITSVQIGSTAGNQSKADLIAGQMRDTGFVSTERNKGNLKKSWDQFRANPKFADMNLGTAADNTILAAYKVYGEMSSVAEASEL